MRAVCAVFFKGGDMVVADKVQVVVYVRELLGHNHTGHIICKDFLGPDIVKPFHCNKVSEPHVRNLVCYEFCPGKQLVLGRVLFQEHALVVELDCAYVLHPAELVARENHEVQLRERKRYAGILLHPFDRMAHLIHNLRHLGNFLRICLAIQSSDFKPVARIYIFLELAGNKGEKIGWNMLGFLEENILLVFVGLSFANFSNGCSIPFLFDLFSGTYGFPVFRYREGEFERCFQIRLVEAREQFSGIGWNVEGVQIVFPFIKFRTPERNPNGVCSV